MDTNNSNSTVSPSENPVQTQHPTSNPVHSQKSFLPIIMGVLVLLLVVGGGAYYLGTQKNNASSQTSNIQPTTTSQNNIVASPTDTPLVSPSETPATSPKFPVLPLKNSYTLKTTNSTSPNGIYKVTEEILGDGNTITLLDNQNKIIAKDIIALNGKEIGYNTKIHCQCGANFKGWYSNVEFVLKVTNGAGLEYEYLVSIDGKVDENSLQRVK